MFTFLFTRIWAKVHLTFGICISDLRVGVCPIDYIPATHLENGCDCKSYYDLNDLYTGQVCDKITIAEGMSIYGGKTEQTSEGSN